MLSTSSLISFGYLAAGGTLQSSTRPSTSFFPVPIPLLLSIDQNALPNYHEQLWLLSANTHLSGQRSLGARPFTLRRLLLFYFASLPLFVQSPVTQQH